MTVKNEKLFYIILGTFSLTVALFLYFSISGMNYYSEPAGTAQLKLFPLGKKTTSGQGAEICRDLCGNGKCEEIVCEGKGCSCPETTVNCPADCNKTPIPPNPGEPCINLCGNGKCESEFNCEGSYCPCFEDEATCPQDCRMISKPVPL